MCNTVKNSQHMKLSVAKGNDCKEAAAPHGTAASLRLFMHD